MGRLHVASTWPVAISVRHLPPQAAPHLWGTSWGSALNFEKEQLIGSLLGSNPALDLNRKEATNEQMSGMPGI